MASAQLTAKTEREKRLKSIITFATHLQKRFEDDRDTSLLDDIQVQMRCLPLSYSSAVSSRQDELDKLGTELWNLSTRLRRDVLGVGGELQEDQVRKKLSVCFLRVFSFFLLDSAGYHPKSRQRRGCTRLMKVALKAAKVCIENKELGHATKVLERAAEYQEVLSQEVRDAPGEEHELAARLQLEYFAVRTALAWEQERMDTAEHMFAKCKQLIGVMTPSIAESIADLLFEVGKDALAKCNSEVAIHWLERAHDMLSEQESELLTQEASELRLSIMQSIVQAHIKMAIPTSYDKAWQTVRLMEISYGDKMVVSLLKIELLLANQSFDSSEFYNVLLRMVRSIVLNETNFQTIMHHIHKLKDHSNVTACKILDEFINVRLLREENQSWIEKAVVTRIWAGACNKSDEYDIGNLKELLNTILRTSNDPLSAPATHAAQTLLWKRVETAANQEQFVAAEAWCRMCQHAIFDKAGMQNKARVARKLIQCALSRQDYASAREAYNAIPESARDEPVTRYLIYKASLRSENIELAAECLDVICRNSTNDSTLLYACVMEAQNAGNKRQAIAALERVLERYNHSAPAGVHLPALLRSTARLLQTELIKDDKIQSDVMGRLCTVFEGALTQAKASKKRPINPAQQILTTQDLEWFSKNAYNLSLTHCAEMVPNDLVRLLNACTEFIRLLNEQAKPDIQGDLCLRLVFCKFLAACTYATLARAEDNVESCLQFYLESRNNCQDFRRAASEGIDKLGGSAQADIISKHFQIVKLELEAVLKLEKWDELDDLFDQCWKYKSPDHYETLADLVLVIHSCMVRADLDESYQRKVLFVLEKIVTLTSRQTSNDITKLSRWLRCLFSLSLTYDETIGLKCINHAVDLAQKRQGGTDRYPQSELEWLATTTFNHAIDYYIQEDDTKCKQWAEQAFIIAQWMEDQGNVRTLLMEKFASLRFQE